MTAYSLTVGPTIRLPDWMLENHPKWPSDARDDHGSASANKLVASQDAAGASVCPIDIVLEDGQGMRMLQKLKRKYVAIY